MTLVLGDGQLGLAGGQLMTLLIAVLVTTEVVSGTEYVVLGIE